jgi:hypothetical protein
LQSVKSATSFISANPADVEKLRPCLPESLATSSGFVVFQQSGGKHTIDLTGTPYLRRVACTLIGTTE